MKFEIEISDKVIKNTISDMLEAHYSDHSSEELEAAGWPKKTELIKLILADEVFMKNLTKGLIKEFVSNQPDWLYDVSQSVRCPTLDKLLKKL